MPGTIGHDGALLDALSDASHGNVELLAHGRYAGAEAVTNFHARWANSAENYRANNGLSNAVVVNKVGGTEKEICFVSPMAMAQRIAFSLNLLARFELDELKRLDAGSWFAAEFGGERIATLDEVLVLCRELGLGFNLEIKATWAEQQCPLDKWPKLKDVQVLVEALGIGDHVLGLVACAGWKANRNPKKHAPNNARLFCTKRKKTEATKRPAATRSNWRSAWSDCSFTSSSW